jgi:NhaP-type Na+/H+ or K+/H+ antiporter
MKKFLRIVLLILVCGSVGFLSGMLLPFIPALVTSGFLGFFIGWNWDKFCDRLNILK